MTGNYDLSKMYILITPCKNEGENLPFLIDSVVVQTIKPVIWVIIDDGSSDNTQDILNESINKYEWIEIVRLEESLRDVGPHLAEVMKKGFDYAIAFCEKNGLYYDYLGNVDGDLILPSTFFENLIHEFENNSNLAIASGGTDYTIGGIKVRAKLSENEPSGGHMLIRRSFFEQCGGIPQSYSMDSVLKAKAKLRGLETKRFEQNIAIEARDVGNAEGYLKGFAHRGESAYYLNVHPLHIFVRSLMYTLKTPYYGGVVYLISYLMNVVLRKKQIDDAEIQDYFWKKWQKIIFRSNG